MLGHSPYRGRAQEEYTLTLELELQREREKNQILEERIRSTELFIEQMKAMQLELEQLNYQCQADLEEERRIRNNLERHELRAYAERVV